MTDELRPLTVEEWIKDRHANCLRIAKTKPHGSDRAGWMEDAEYFQAVLDRFAARVGEGWCFDMEKAPRDGTRFIAITKGGIQRIDQRHQVQASSAKYFWAEVPIDPYVAWCPLPPPPETNDDE